MKKLFKIYSGLPNSIYILFFARIINSMGNFVYPLLTLFLTDRLGLSAGTAGKFLSLAAVSYVPGALAGGKLADIFGRKKVMVIAQGFAAICFIPCAFLGKSMLIPWLLIIAGVFNGAVQPANSAMVADLTNQQNRKTAFSLLYLGINIGFAIGPVIAGFLYKNYIIWVFLGNTIGSLTAMMLVALFVKETIPDNSQTNENADSENEKAEEGSALKLLLSRPQLLIFAVLSTVYSFAYSQGNFSTTIQLKEIFNDSASKMLGGIQAANAIVVITMTTLIVYLTKKNKPILNIAAAGVFFASGFGMQRYISSYPLFILATVIWSIGEVLNATNSGVYIADHAPKSHRGRFNSILSMITGAGSAIGPYVMGGYIQNYGVRMVWPFVFIITMAAAVLLYVLYIYEIKTDRHKREAGL